MRWLVGMALWVAMCAQAQIAYEVYGRLDIAVELPSRPYGDDGQLVDHDALRITSGSRNRIGIVASHEGAGSWRSRLTLEQSLFGQNGRPFANEEAWRAMRPFDALAVLTVSHYAFGRFDVGRRTDVARDVAVTVHPWGGDTVAGDNCASILAWPCPPMLKRAFGVAYESPSFSERWTHSGQLYTLNGQATVAARTVYAAGARRVDVGVSLTDRSNWLLPMGWVEPVGPWRLHGLWTTGRRQGQAGDYVFAGATHPWRGGEFRLGVGRYRTDRARDHVQWSAGLHYPVRGDVIVYGDLALLRARARSEHAQMDLGVKFRF